MTRAVYLTPPEIGRRFKLRPYQLRCLSLAGAVRRTYVNAVPLYRLDDLERAMATSKENLRRAGSTTEAP